jgi:hypothetical protein
MRRVARFEVQWGASLDPPEQWEPVATRDAGEDAERRQVIREAAKETGWYRLRRADYSDSPWAYYHVTAHPRTGEPEVSCPRPAPWQ